MAQYPSYPGAQTASRADTVNAFMRGVYGWMSLGLMLTAGVAWFTAASPLGLTLVQSPMLVLMLVLAQFGMVIALSAAIHKLSGTAASLMFVAYSALTGLTLSSIFFVYSSASIFQTFLVTGGMFGATSVYGMVTKRDLTGMGSFMFMGLIGIVIASVVNMFMQSSALSFGISVIGVIVFTGLTAYDTQKLKYMGETMPMDDGTAVRRGTILGALTLYLDFLNLFLMLLRLFGSSRD
ncbi:MAG: Bax inhibitor-1/YccA family protein [Humidesulfovibrio sp.]|uniref:Bax inhibitor-1/YccA family protein n=1 Tax=Humidesulfovibrio sp. TaxID=2910988 RepID=UPI0027374B19|nr:Bax inhibitor-1/YccA family protein [Humidesulfovibrio sp.]MDP2849303.1 Bax inhibitor-1/YccA family protein [Humidesulfovibrio sp.]